MYLQCKHYANSTEVGNSKRWNSRAQYILLAPSGNATIATNNNNILDRRAPANQPRERSLEH